ncbi:threonylcarbamoyl-AMP synthase [Candidatus Gracilibacteria bacterium]|nr:threonylcarbamoyl-AMP synthase [Candidatus Gracilibacteria bacterium]
MAQLYVIIIAMSILEKAVEVLQKGGVIAHATDTCYGFAADIFNKDAVEKVYELKQMARSKPVSILVSSLEEAQKFGRFNESALELAKKHWPGALTIIVRRTEQLPQWINPEDQTVGIRLPGDEISRGLASRLGRPITTTSANITTQPSPYSVAVIQEQFAGSPLQPDFYLDSGTLASTNPPSTIVDCTVEPPKVIRQGGLRV